MKFATLTVTLIGALLAATPATSLAGGPRGLLHSPCNCATQKGATQKGHVAQKGHIAQKATCRHAGCGGGGCVQKGTIVQKGHFAHQKGHFAQKGCSTKGGCGSCNICIPNILPALVHGVGGLLNELFCCDSCGSSKGYGHGKSVIAQKGAHQKGSGCGCGTSHKGRIGSPPNPFIDDELQAPPIPDAEARSRRLWDLPKQVSTRSRTTTVTRPAVTRPTATRPTVARPSVKTASAKSEPRTLSVKVAEPISREREAKSVTVPAPVVRTSSQTPTGLRIPKNPLRGT